MVSEATEPTAQEPIRVLVVDDHPLFRQGVVRVLEQTPGLLVAGEASDGLEAVDRARALQPHVVLMDINMPRCGGLEATLRLQAQMPEMKVLIFTVSEKEDDLFTAVRFGARGYLLKDARPEEIRSAVPRVAAGEAVFSPSMAAMLLAEFRRMEEPQQPEPQAPPPLSDREQEVLRLLGTGSSNREIAEALIISENTVKTHLRNILEKLHLRNRSQIAVYAARLGIPR